MQLMSQFWILLKRKSLCNRKHSVSIDSKTVTTDENSARAFVKNFISVQLSKVSEEVDESLVDYVNAFDPSKVAAQVEAVLFERWGFFDLSKPVSRNYSVVLSRLSNDGIKDFRRHILLGEISPQTLFNMSLDELWQKYLPPNRMGAMVWEFWQQQEDQCKDVI